MRGALLAGPGSESVSSADGSSTTTRTPPYGEGAELMVTRKPYCSARRPTAARPSCGTSPIRDTSSEPPPASAAAALATVTSVMPTPQSSISMTAPLWTGMSVT